MFKYKIINTPVCALCGTQSETVEQLLVTCEAVKGFKEHAVTWFLNKKDFVRGDEWLKGEQSSLTWDDFWKRSRDVCSLLLVCSIFMD
jgi:hypothetical protein